MYILELENDYFNNRGSEVLNLFMWAVSKYNDEAIQFKMKNDPFNMLFIYNNGKLFAKMDTEKNNKINEIFEVASIKHIERLLTSIEHNYTGIKLESGDMTLEEWIFNNLTEVYFLVGLETIAETQNANIFELTGRECNVEEVEGQQSCINDCIGVLEWCYQSAIALNNPSKEVVQALRLVTDYVQDEEVTESDFEKLKSTLMELKNANKTM
ncbi:hypothetical protein [Staphylococcus hsinchuensis]|uniref:Phage protein n=1 Tax=Staphylococcus hsinchuensis TaxID=3051183 RepID=A0ABZ3EE63_9STAP